MMTLRPLQLPTHSQSHQDSAIPPVVFARLRERARGKGERRLAVAILEDAVRCFERNRAEATFNRRQLYWETEQWFAGRDPFPIFSFESICLILGLKADVIRVALREWAVRRADGRVPPFLEVGPAITRTKLHGLSAVPLGRLKPAPALSGWRSKPKTA